MPTFQMTLLNESAFRFFFANAAYSYNPRTETSHQGRAKNARRLAKAERVARALEYSYKWDHDPFGAADVFGDHGKWCDKAARGKDHEHTIEQCSIMDCNGNVVETLCGIIDADTEVHRVIEAELALQILDF